MKKLAIAMALAAVGACQPAAAPALPTAKFLDPEPPALFLDPVMGEYTCE